MEGGEVGYTIQFVGLLVIQEGCGGDSACTSTGEGCEEARVWCCTFDRRKKWLRALERKTLLWVERRKLEAAEWRLGDPSLLRSVYTGRKRIQGIIEQRRKSPGGLAGLVSRDHTIRRGSGIHRFGGNLALHGGLAGHFADDGFRRGRDGELLAKRQPIVDLFFDAYEHFGGNTANFGGATGTQHREEQLVDRVHMLEYLGQFLLFVGPRTTKTLQFVHLILDVVDKSLKRLFVAL